MQVERAPTKQRQRIYLNRNDQIRHSHRVQSDKCYRGPKQQEILFSCKRARDHWMDGGQVGRFM